MAATTNDIKMNIIKMITQINDISELERIYSSIEKEVEETNKKLKLEDAIIELRENISYQEVLSEQNYQPINYQDFRELADEIEWEHSLEELLAELD